MKRIFSDHPAQAAADLFWESRMPKLSHQGKTMNNRSKGEKQRPSAGTWKENEYLSPSTHFKPDEQMVHGQINTLGNVWQQRSLESCKTRKATSTQWSIISSSTSSGLQNHSSSSVLRHSLQQSKVDEKQFDIPEEATIQKMPRLQVKIKESDRSLRIITAVIERMKHWSEYAYKIALLFEVLATLDSAVTSGPYGAKTFLLRDGQDSVPCVFYEMDRDLPRLIRGRVHRCMGSYDKKRNLFKCVSVRPASVAEQRTFKEFVKVADAEMQKYVKSINEI
ncbi:spermatogenesis-associated protein 22 isoform X2 [Rhinatrema bivittatum]|uniref:spermatogenesis-associated protein 22 isoform X2 n=1 Tax=Rhinatrema bivittatum TaxID=194408 RepID=UPI00112BBAC7|nr:spermatogenesis-associated protein 22 isoform X2 [Rhinatrema bivittatum]XP_029469995.1 spermatogenesis-associated protein 22 isoform X2 [Rhinatrema bivittatum]